MLAIVAAVAGTGYASGRELVLFFAQTGRAQWIGIGFAPVVFGLLTALLCRCGAGMGANSIAVLCKRLMGKRMGAVAGMLCGAGEMGALALPVRYGWLWGAGIALLIALLVNLSGLRPLPWLGLIVLTAGVIFYGALAMDPRSPRVWMEGAVQLALEDSWPASILLALAYGAMNAALASNVILRFGQTARPWKVGLLCGSALLALLAVAAGAIARGGRLLLGQAMPTVILAARWGLAGFWICAAFSYLCAVTTLAAVVGGLIEWLRSSPSRRWQGCWAYGGASVWDTPRWAGCALHCCWRWHVRRIGCCFMGEKVKFRRAKPIFMGVTGSVTVIRT